MDDVPDQRESSPQGCWDMISFSSSSSTGLYTVSLIGLLLICSATAANACTHSHTSSMDLSESTERFSERGSRDQIRLLKLSVLSRKQTFKQRACRQSNKHTHTHTHSTCPGCPGTCAESQTWNSSMTKTLNNVHGVTSVKASHRDHRA